MSSEITPLPSITNPKPAEIELTENEKLEEQTSTENSNEKSSARDMVQIAENSNLSFASKFMGYVANIAAYGHYEKIDNENITKYRSTANLSKHDDIKKAIDRQKKELEDAKKEAEKAKIQPPVFFTGDDVMYMIDITKDELNRRIFGPMWMNWTTGEDFLAALRYALESIITTFDPILEVVDQLQDYINDSAGESLAGAKIDVYTSRNGDTQSIPIGIIAIRCINTIIDYIRELLENLERLAEEYTPEELNALIQRKTVGENYGAAIQSINRLIQQLMNCIKPYLQNIMIAIILDVIDFIVEKLDKAGILSPTGPLKMIPIMITLVRSIMAGNLEAIEEMIVQSINKMINLVQLLAIAWDDPSILWADTDRMDKEIAIARYKEMTDYDEKTGTERKELPVDDYLTHKTSMTAGVRMGLQDLKNSTNGDINAAVEKINDLFDTETLASKFTNLFKSKKEIEKNSDQNICSSTLSKVANCRDEYAKEDEDDDD